ncbi:MAG: biopolymer transporter ExbD [Prevotella sp.]|nr:biopolymer transporter ExbD [Prevotella sp.]MBQ4631927.1 biopolymer transporter ExbD [Prevotella sp.]MBQ5606248.1 biopolymer transporter ExbD [Prevotella sp.]MBQ8628492.1 biopolymer transporter ExbD [Prevotella sp.]
MGKVKIEKKDIWIDMTPMSDVMVLLLCFFMLTSTFVKHEAVKVNTPGSVSEIKVPENNVLSILIDNRGKVFLGMDKPNDLEYSLTTMAGAFDMALTQEQVKKFRATTNIGVPMNEMAQFLALPESEANDYIKDKGVPTDSIAGGKSEFQLWVEAAKDNNPDMKIAIKADAKTPYKVIKKVMSELQDMEENRYYLITSYKTVED